VGVSGGGGRLAFNIKDNPGQGREKNLFSRKGGVGHSGERTKREPNELFKEREKEELNLCCLPGEKKEKGFRDFIDLGKREGGVGIECLNCPGAL